MDTRGLITMAQEISAMLKSRGLGPQECAAIAAFFYGSAQPFYKTPEKTEFLETFRKAGYEYGSTRPVKLEVVE